MNPWMLFVLAILAIIIGTMFRQPRQARSEPETDEEDDYAPPPKMPVPPPLPQRRRQPPPLPRPRRVPVAEVISVAQATPPAVTPAAATKAPMAERRPPSQAAIQVIKLLSDRQSLRAAIVLREVLDPPLCKRRKPAGTDRQTAPAS